MAEHKIPSACFFFPCITRHPHDIETLVPFYTFGWWKFYFQTLCSVKWKNVFNDIFVIPGVHTSILTWLFFFFSKKKKERNGNGYCIREKDVVIYHILNHKKKCQVYYNSIIHTLTYLVLRVSSTLWVFMFIYAHILLFYAYYI